VPVEIVESRDLCGGCIHRVMHLALADGRAIVAKVSREAHRVVFEEEAAGLRALAATDTVLVPEPLAVAAHDGEAVLLMTAIEPASADDASWRRFGEELAALHAVDAGTRFGFEMNNHLGITPQPNEWRDDWVEFNAELRLGYQLRLARDARLLSRDEASRIERVIADLERLIPRRPKPALLHGDLWSGNALPAKDDRGPTRIAVIDPAVYIGDGWADIAMMRLFGGFPAACFAAYEASVTDRENVESRIAVYQLYHVLNHINLFGRGYVGQAMGLAARLV
jgi:fructosamine-3-kinase